MPDGPPPPDQAARDRITEDLGATLFVEAGAGSGKTTALVDRVVALVTSGRAELRAIAAITFTEKAGAELRDRIRRGSSRARAEDDPGGDVGAAAGSALDQLDGAAIGTLHSFAQRLLSEHPVEAGLPPRVEVLDEVSSAVAFERRWSMFRDQLLADPALERTILLLFASGVRADALRRWPGLRRQLGPGRGAGPRDASRSRPPVHELFRQARAAVGRGVRGAVLRDPADGCGSGSTRSPSPLAELADIADELELLEALGPGASTKLPSFKVGNIGANRRRSTTSTICAARVREAGDTLAAVGAEVANACARRLGSAIRRFTLDTRRRAPARRAAGVPRSAGAGPGPAAPPGPRPGGAGTRSTSATSTCSSTSSRTPTPSRSSWRCASPPPTPGASAAGTAAWDAVA